MANPNLKVYGFAILVFSSLFMFVLLSIKLESTSSFFSLFLFLGIGTLLFRKKGVSYFLLSYFLSIFSFSAIVFTNLRTTGTYFLGGGDDELFYEFAVRLSKYWLSDFGIEYLVGMSYKLYIHLHGFYFDFLKILGICDYSPIHLFLINAFVGGVISNYVYKIISILIKNKDNVKLYALLTVTFPLTIFYTSNLLRECFVIMFFVMSIFVTINPSFSILKKVLVLLLLLILSYFIRPASAFFIASFPGVYMFLGITNFKLKIFGFLTFVVLLILFLQYRSLIYDRDISETQQMYQDLSSETASKNSIGLKLINSKNPALKVASIFYIILSPIPPPIIKNFNFNTVLISIGAITWYFIFPAFILFIFFNKRSKELKTFILPFAISFFACSTLVTFTSSDARHIQPFYPMAVFIGIFFIDNFRIIYKKFLFVYSFLIFLGVGSYIVVKFLI